MLKLNLVLYTTIKPTHTLVHLIKEGKSTNDSKNKPF